MKFDYEHESQKLVRQAIRLAPDYENALTLLLAAYVRLGVRKTQRHALLIAAARALGFDDETVELGTELQGYNLIPKDKYDA